MKLAALALAFSASMASAECYPTESVYEVIGGQFKEYRALSGLTPDAAAVVEVWINPETGTFTIFATLPGGQSCVMATGQHLVEHTAPGGL